MKNDVKIRFYSMDHEKGDYNEIDDLNSNYKRTTFHVFNPCCIWGQYHTENFCLPQSTSD